MARPAPTAARRNAPAEPPSAASAVARFLLGSLLAIAVVVVGGFFALRSVTTDQAERNTRDLVQVQGRLAQEAGVTDGLLSGDREAIAKMDDLVVGQIISESLVRVKLWTRDGRVLYSDEPALIGERFELEKKEKELFETGGADAELSDLSKPENRFERQEDKLLEAHTPIRTPSGTPVLFEVYQRFESVNASAQRQLKALAPPLVAGLLVLLLFQAPLAWSLTRRLQRGHREREDLLASAIEASSQERRRIAADLHDGVVQDLAGVAFGLAPMADEAERKGEKENASVLRSAVESLRQGVRDLRSLLVEIHPPSLESTGLKAALSDLLSPLAARGIETHLEVDENATGGPDRDPLVYRVACEAVRNVLAHAQAESVRMEVTHPAPGATRLTVEDDGRGFDAGARATSEGAGHLGLTLLEGLVTQADGDLTVTSTPGEGTRVQLDFAAR